MLRRILGGKCVYCGVTDNLTFDCIRPRGHTHHSAGSVARVSFYKQEMRCGNLQLLCAFCNSKKQDKAQPRYLPFVCVLPPLR
jgi:5-methylcytosine-specific restriction endonuclease McrA